MRPLSAVVMKQRGVPLVILKAAFGTIALTLPAAPDAFWQSLQ